MTRIAVTGTNGFIGRALLHRLAADQRHEIVALQRRPPESALPGVHYLLAPDLRSPQDWRALLQGTDVLVHTAARVHVMRESSSDPLAEFRAVNVTGTLALARTAAAAGVRRLVFLSSVKVSGETTEAGRPFRASDIPAPSDAYGISKMEAEAGLRALSAENGMELVIVRPPLVYGPGVKANFASLMDWIAMGLPLPLGGIENRRSLVGLDNLVDFLVTCAEHPAAANQVFLVSDGEDLSTTDLVRRMALALSVRPRLLRVPTGWLRRAASWAGRAAAADRLCSSLQVDIAPARELLGWRPPVSVDEGLRRAAIGRRSPQC